jgi:integrase
LKKHQSLGFPRRSVHTLAYLPKLDVAGSSPVARSLADSRRSRVGPFDVDSHGAVRRRARTAGIKTKIGCHTFRATGITAYLENGGTPAQQIAAHESPRTTKLYDRTTDQISLDEIERIAI